MVYSVRNRMAYLGRRVDDVRGEVVSYTRPGVGTIQLSQAPGQTTVEVLNPETATIQIRYVDIICTVADLIFPSAGAFLPQRGDYYVWEGSRYNVVPIAATNECYNFTTMYKDRIRIHGVMSTKP